MTKGEIFTVGHSTRSAIEFIELLKAHGIRVLVDVRRFPGSRRYPWFGSEELRKDLKEAGIEYHHFEALGGRRKPLPDSPHPEWKNDSFRGYADYMDTDEFRTAADQLQHLAQSCNTAIMCSEAVWWRCHRSLVSDYLKDEGWTVWHIMTEQKKEEHPYTTPVRQKRLF